MSSFLNSQEFIERIKQELLLYVQLVPLIHNLKDNDVLDDIILDYHHFMLNYNTNCNQYKSIPDHIKLIWRIHLMHPYTYYNDCMNHFLTIIYCFDKSCFARPRVFLVPGTWYLVPGTARDHPGATLGSEGGRQTYNKPLFDWT